MEKVDCNLHGSDIYRILHHEFWELRLPEQKKVVKCVECGLVYMNSSMDDNERIVQVDQIVMCKNR